MANREYRAQGLNADGGFVKWDWSKNKYIWVSRNDALNKKSINKPTKPGQSRYDWQKGGNKVAARRPSFKVPVKKALRQPLQAANKRGKIKSPSPKKSPVKSRVQTDGKLPVCRQYNAQPDGVHLNKENIPFAAVIGSDRHSKARDVAGPPPGLHAGHVTILSVLSNRLIHVNAALTFWHQGPNAFISYLLRTEDDAATVDVLPVLAHCLKDRTAVSKQLSMGACLELLPVLKRLLSSKYEDYVKSSLDVIRTMLRFWWSDLMAQKSSTVSGNLQQSRSISGIYTSSIAMTDIITKLSKRKDNIGKKAEIVSSLLAQL